MHLARVRDYRNGMRFRQGGDLSCLRDAADPVGVELYVIDGASRE